MKMPRGLLRNERGFSLMETMVAMAILGPLAIGSFALIQHYRKQASRAGGVCSTRAHSVLAKIRGYGALSGVATYNALGASRTPPSPGPFNNDGIADTDRWTGTSDTNVIGTYVAPNPNPVPIRNAILIDNSINAVLAIYNSADYCSAFRAYANLQPTDTNLLRNESIQLQIQPFDLTTGAIQACAARPLHLYPQGNGDAYTSVPPKATASADYRSDYGLEVTVQEQYINKDGLAEKCFAKERFQFVSDRTAPPAPTLVATLTNGTQPRGDYCSGAPTSGALQVQIGYAAGTSIEPGSVMVCRDSSETIQQPTPPIGNGLDPDRLAPGNYAWRNCLEQNVYVVADYTSGYFPPTTSTGLSFTHSDVPGIRTLQQGPWVPCDQVTACGTAPSSVTVSTSDGTQPYYELTYTGLDYDCRVKIEAATIDTAGNTSTDTRNPGNAFTTAPWTDPTIMSATSTIQWDVLRPSCGTYCTTNGYFWCGGAC